MLGFDSDRRLGVGGELGVIVYDYGLPYAPELLEIMYGASPAGDSRGMMRRIRRKKRRGPGRGIVVGR